MRRGYAAWTYLLNAPPVGRRALSAEAGGGCTESQRSSSRVARKLPWTLASIRTSNSAGIPHCHVLALYLAVFLEVATWFLQDEQILYVSLPVEVAAAIARRRALNAFGLRIVLWHPPKRRSMLKRL